MRVYSSQRSRITKVSQSEITAVLSQKGRAIPPEFMCFNTNAVRVRSWTAYNFVNAVRSLSPQILRVPGGASSNYWNWRRGGLIQDLKGLPDDLPSFLRSRRDRQYSASKLENFVAGFKLTNTAPLFALNVMTSNLEDQLQMLKKAENLGITVKSIELGNEFYLKRKNYLAVFPEPEDYARKALRWTIKLKQAFPEAQVGIVGVHGQQQKNIDNRQHYWNQKVFPKTLQAADAVTLHIYLGHGLGPVVMSSKQQYPFFDQKDIPIILGEPFRRLQDITQLDGFRDIPSHKKIWVTEYSLYEDIFSHKANRKPKVVGSWAHGLYTLTMSLILLEDKRVEKICNHMLIGKSTFAAIYDSDRSFINPSDPFSTSSPLGLSATGSSLKFLGAAVKNATTAHRIQFPGGPTAFGKQNFEYPIVYGWFFRNNNGHKKAIILNLSDRDHQVDFSKLFPRTIKFKQVMAPPRTLVTDPSALDEKVGNTSGSLSLPAYSLTYLKDS